MESSNEQISIQRLAFKASKCVANFGKLNRNTEDSERNSSAEESEAYNFLNIDPCTETSILSQIENLFQLDAEDDESCPFANLDDVGSLAIVSHSISAHMRALDKAQSKRAHHKISFDVNVWLSKIFGLIDFESFLHSNHLDSVVHLVRYLFSTKFENFSSSGNQAFRASSPIVYAHSIDSNNAYQHVCRQLGIPLSSIRHTPCSKQLGTFNKVCLIELEQLFKEDLSNGHRPLLLIAELGSFPFGNLHDLEALSELCAAYDVWLHLKGNALAILGLPININRKQSGNVFQSATLSLGSWLSIPGLPLITFYKCDNEIDPKNNDIILPGSYSNLSYLPLWTAVQALGYSNFHNRIQSLFFNVIKFFNLIAAFEQFRILSPKAELSEEKLLALIMEETDVQKFVNAAITAVVFQYIPSRENNDSASAKKHADNADLLNSWLWKTMQLEKPKFSVELCNVDDFGLVIKFNPFAGAVSLELSGEDFCDLGTFIEQQLIILETTVQNKSTLRNLIEHSPVLRYVELSNWVGLGGVRYVPEDWESLLTDNAKSELNDLNQRMISALRTTDSAFSVGLSSDDFVCVRFGMLTPHSNIEELLDLVIKTGKSVEENSKVLETMSELVKKGIEAATEDLQRENDEKLWQEGLLRHLPVVSTFVNWWSPVESEPGVRGRSLNLREGVIESTENIYKYHMQTKKSPRRESLSKPPSPLVQKSIMNRAVTESHKRSDSRTSNQSIQILENKSNVTF